MSTQMQGKTVLVTGGTGGIGRETAVGLARMGATVVVTGRDRERGEAAVAGIRQASANERVSLLLADLERQADVRRLAAEAASAHPRLDVLINNVGYLGPEPRLTADGVEATLAVNVLAPLLLTELLSGPLAAAGGRVVNVTGGMLGGAQLDLRNLQAEKGYLGMRTYSHAKLAMMALSYEQARRLAGTGITLTVAYPGGAATAMTAGMTPAMVPLWMRLFWPLFGVIMGNASPARAARSSIFLASSPDVAGVTGAYYDTNSQRAAWPKPVLDDRLRGELWALSRRLLGLGPEQSGNGEVKGALAAGAA
jgi:NAD(P)-dependent dehydrogenase (short-subunit alcohol dehydrogenase family)